MTDRRDSDEDLMFDVQMGLRGSPLRKDADARIIARKIVAHLKLCRWRWWRLPPDEMHGSFLPKRDDDQPPKVTYEPSQGPKRPQGRGS